MSDKKEESKMGSPQVDPCIDRIKLLLKESSMFHNYFSDHVDFTAILNRT